MCLISAFEGEMEAPLLREEEGFETFETYKKVDPPQLKIWNHTPRSEISS